MEIQTYKAPSGQWSFVIFDDDGVDVVRGGGYPTEDAAADAAAENLQRTL